MPTENNKQEEEVIVTEENNEATGNEDAGTDTISLSKSEYEKMNQTLGSLKRELKDYKKSKEDTKNGSTESKPDDTRLFERVEKMALRSAGLSHEDDIALAKTTAKKWGMDLEEVLLDDDFKIKLERQQSGRDNLAATSKVKGGAGSSQAKNTPEYWIAKGTPPSANDVPDRKTRATIARAMMQNTKSGKKFYND